MLSLPPPPERVRATWPGSTPTNPWGTPQPCRIAIVGEAPGDDEAWLKRPFVGASGIELRNQLLAAGIDANACLLTNVIDVQPPGNNFPAFCLRKEDLPRDYPAYLPPIETQGGHLYLHPDLLYNGARLRDELATARPNVVIALGGKACWALLGSGAISQLRGTVHRTVTSTPYKCVPTWHPASVLRNWRQRPVAVVDLVKALAESASPAIVYDSVELWLKPDLADLFEFEGRFIRSGQLHSVDVETSQDEITCVGLAPDPDHAIVVPFRTDARPFKNPNGGDAIWRPTGNYWPTLDDELAAWSWVRRQVERRDTDILGQNFLFDIQRFLRYGIRPMRVKEDTMLAHHSRFAEMPKNLGFLGSVYTNFPRWKHFGNRHLTEDKRDD